MTDRTDADELSDGGTDCPAAGDADAARMRDVSHTPPNGDGTNGIWARGDGDDARSAEAPVDDE
jgi:hypothetical protein